MLNAIRKNHLQCDIEGGFFLHIIISNVYNQAVLAERTKEGY